MSEDARIAQLEEQHRSLTLKGFARRDAWELGRLLAERALSEDLPVAIDVRNASGILFHASMPGATSDNDAWAARKAATALRFEMSTALLEARMNAAGGRSMFEQGWLDPVIYAVAGGAVPIRVVGTGVVAVATISGLPSADDHDTVVRGIETLAARTH